jgi:hypothetical protein
MTDGEQSLGLAVWPNMEILTAFTARAASPVLVSRLFHPHAAFEIRQ